MKYLLIILTIFLFACSKGKRFKVIAEGEKYSLTIETESEITTYTDLNGKFRKTVKGEYVGLYVSPIEGAVTAELFINGNLCNGVYNMTYKASDNTEYFICQ